MKYLPLFFHLFQKISRIFLHLSICCACLKEEHIHCFVVAITPFLFWYLTNCSGKFNLYAPKRGAGHLCVAPYKLDLKRAVLGSHFDPKPPISCQLLTSTEEIGFAPPWFWPPELHLRQLLQLQKPFDQAFNPTVECGSGT